MTTTVKIEAHTTSEKEVNVVITDGDVIVEDFSMQDGENAERYVYDGREISVQEVDK